jgi:hypothetical protein
METEHIILVLIVVVAAFFLMREGPSPVISEMSSNTFKISDNQYKYEYQLDKSEIILSGTLVGASASPGIRAAGVDAVLHYLDGESLSTFKRTQNPRICTAPFFNSHAKHKQLIPANTLFTEKLAAGLAAMTSINYTQTATWRPFNLRGYCIKSASVIEIYGKKASLPHNMFDNCMTMIVTDFKLIDQTVVAIN